MQITKKHIDDIYERLEDFASHYDEIEHNSILFAARMFRNELILVLMAKSEEDIQKSEEFAKKAMKIVEGNLPTNEKIDKIIGLARKDIKCESHKRWKDEWKWW